MDNRNWETTSTWKCLACGGEPEFNNADMMKHFQEVHGINPTLTPGTRQGVLHLDGEGFHQNDFKWTVNGLEFFNSIVSIRVKKQRTSL